MTSDEPYLRQAIALARDNASRGGRPFGAVVVKDGQVLATGVNEILASGDPTAHAELLAIRAAARALGAPRLDGCTVYASVHPCPMCLAAMHLCGVQEVAYAYSNEEGEPYGLSTAAVYAEMAKPVHAQQLPVRHVPVRAEGEPLYAYWRRQVGPA
jgi:tRNA(Arg) A34 adenosine deaminase TadA